MFLIVSLATSKIVTSVVNSTSFGIWLWLRQREGGHIATAVRAGLETGWGLVVVGEVVQEDQIASRTVFRFAAGGSYSSPQYCGFFNSVLGDRE